MNLSETAFVVPRPDGDHDLRWFTPAVEVDLCGHATLAAAHVLGGSARFHTSSGLLTCASTDRQGIEMDFPADPPAEAPMPASLELPSVRWFGYGQWSALAELDTAALVRNLRPDLASISALETRALIVTASGDRPGVDCVSRVFGPNVGIPEDPVTGSAHCAVGRPLGPTARRRRARRRAGLGSGRHRPYATPRCPCGHCRPRGDHRVRPPHRLTRPRGRESGPRRSDAIAPVPPRGSVRARRPSWRSANSPAPPPRDRAPWRAGDRRPHQGDEGGFVGPPPVRHGGEKRAVGLHQQPIERAKVGRLADVVGL